MKNAFFTGFRILLALVLLGKILNWSLHFSNETNQVLNTVMFSLIGIAYLVVGYLWDHPIAKMIIMACGVFLIVMNFFTGNVIVDIVGIVCILAPMLIARFHRQKMAN